VTFLSAHHATVAGHEELADRVAVTVTGLDVLVNNVGGLYDTRWETADGYEEPHRHLHCDRTGRRIGSGRWRG
jgi:hypothetical protein